MKRLMLRELDKPTTLVPFDTYYVGITEPSRPANYVSLHIHTGKLE